MLLGKAAAFISAWGASFDPASNTATGKVDAAGYECPIRVVLIAAIQPPWAWSWRIIISMMGC
jgi:hypothetical protein